MRLIYVHIIQFSCCGTPVRLIVRKIRYLFIEFTENLRYCDKYRYRDMNDLYRDMIFWSYRPALAIGWLLSVFIVILMDAPKVKRWCSSALERVYWTTRSKDTMPAYLPMDKQVTKDKKILFSSSLRMSSHIPSLHLYF